MYTPREVAVWLGIAPVTLRKWAMEFRLWLSPSATRVSRGVARRYTDADLIVLCQVRAYLARSFTYTEVKSFLRHAASAAIATTDPHSLLNFDNQNRQSRSRGFSRSRPPEDSAPEQ